VVAVVTWLKSLAGTIPQDYITPPQLPAVGSSRSRANPGLVATAASHVLTFSR
jgi:hypothetical protein